MRPVWIPTFCRKPYGRDARSKPQLDRGTFNLCLDCCARLLQVPSAPATQAARRGGQAEPRRGVDRARPPRNLSNRSLAALSDETRPACVFCSVMSRIMPLDDQASVSGVRFSSKLYGFAPRPCAFYWVWFVCKPGHPRVFVAPGRQLGHARLLHRARLR